MRRLLFWSLFTVTMAIYATMLAWSLPTVTAAAGGLVPFDMRFAGYSFADATAFLTALTPQGADFYLNIQQTLDLFYPGFLALTLLFTLAALAPKQLGTSRWIAATIALPVGAFDYIENIFVRQMLTAGPNGITPDLVATASQWTTLKAAASTIVMSVLLALLFGWAVVKLIPLLHGRFAPRAAH